METATQALNALLDRVTDEIYVHVPCQVTAVHGNTVDAIAYINDDEDDFVLYNIPIKRQETQSAYIFLGIKKGDYGTLIFYDRSIDDYRNGETYYNGDDRQHNINDRAFELGFIPNPSAFIYPTNQEIEIGLKDGKAKISINANGDINIISNGNISTTVQGNMTATVSGDVSTTVQGNMVANVNGDVSTTVQGNMTATVSGDVSTTVQKDMVANVNGDVNITAPATNITSNVNITGNLVVSGTSTLNGTCTFETKPFMEHTHMTLAPKTPTTGVL